MVEAMRLVRDALGDDAIIVATREEEGGVRLTAAIDVTCMYFLTGCSLQLSRHMHERLHTRPTTTLA